MAGNEIAAVVQVIGTNGMNPDDLNAVAPAADSAIFLRAGNMSLGVNLLVLLTKTVARALDDDFEINSLKRITAKKLTHGRARL